jgi:hypothetical protein
LHSQKDKYESTLARVKHEAEVKVAKLLKEIAEEKALLVTEKHHAKVEHATDESHFHDEEYAIKHQAATVLSTAESKAAAKLAAEVKALAHEAALVKAGKAHEKEVLHAAHKKHTKEVNMVTKTLEEVINLALKKKHEYKHEIKTLHQEEATDKAADKHEEIVDQHREAAERHATMNAIAMTAAEKKLVDQVMKKDHDL